MERESEQMQASKPTLCHSGCGLYGSPATDNLCSLCYKEALKKKQQPPSDARPSVTSQQQSSSVSSFTSASPSFTTASPSFSPMPSSSSIDTAQPTVPIRRNQT